MVSEFHGRPAIRNGILGNLTLADFARIRPHLQRVVLKERAVLQEARKRIEYAYFIETGLVSLRTLTTGSILETALVGCHGAVGASVVLGWETSIHHSIVLIAGNALRIRIDELHRAMSESSQLREHLLLYMQFLMIQSSQTALCGVRHELAQRLASWLSIACDTLDRDVLMITHDHLSIILGLRRPGLTEALNRFEDEGLIRKARGFIQICDRQSLRQKACGCYEVITRPWEERPRASSMHAHHQVEHREEIPSRN